MNLTNSLFESKKFILLWQITLALFCLSALTSKSGFQIFLGFLVLLAAFGLNWHQFVKQEKLAFAILLLYPLAIVCGFFSLGHTTSALHTALAWPWPLVVLPTVLIKNRRDDIRILLIGLSASLAVACFYCWVLFAKDFHWAFGEARVPSFWDISRWGVFSGLALVLLAGALMVKGTPLRRRTGLFLLGILDFSCLLLSNNRGPWLAFAISAIVFFILYPKLWKLIIPMAAVFMAVVLSSRSLSIRVNSIAAVQTTQDGHMTSTDKSNEGRLHMWKVALDFFKEQPWFGTGFENSEEPLKNFLARQEPEYRKKYTSVEYSYRDQHSSPLTTLVQNGLLFFVTFWSIVIAGALCWLKEWWREKSLFSATILAALVFHLVLCFFYTSFLSYEIVSFIPLLVLRRGAYGAD